jgi:hypothetical protein
MVRKTKEPPNAKARDAATVADGSPGISSSGSEYITVTAQQSRYALDAVDAPNSKEVSPYLMIYTSLTMSLRNVLILQ